METVLANEGASQTELVKTTGIDRSTLADLVNTLPDQLRHPFVQALEELSGKLDEDG